MSKAIITIVLMLVEVTTSAITIINNLKTLYHEWKKFRSLKKTCKRTCKLHKCNRFGGHRHCRIKTLGSSFKHNHKRIEPNVQTTNKGGKQG